MDSSIKRVLNSTPLLLQRSNLGPREEVDGKVLDPKKCLFLCVPPVQQPHLLLQ